MYVNLAVSWVVDLRSQQQSVPQKLKFDTNKEDTPCAGMSGLPGSSVKCENLQQPSIKSFPAKSMSRTSSTSTIQARKKQLKLEEAKQKAKIQMELIEKQLEADIAELNNDVYSSQYEDEPITRDVEHWLEKSCQQSERFAPEMDIPAGDPCTFAQHHGQPLASRMDANSGDTVHLLATALKDLTAVSICCLAICLAFAVLCDNRELRDHGVKPLRRKVYGYTVVVISYIRDLMYLEENTSLLIMS
ncbi:hypothetical protein ACJJTC_003614 [Scirpophaga incertulas]